MLKMKLFLLSLFICLISTSAFAEGFLCVADAATGFKYNKSNQAWKSSTFNVEKNKYIIRRPTEEDEYRSAKFKNAKWVVSEFGSTTLSYDCAKDINEYGYLNCAFYSFGKFIFNSKELRYQIYMQGAYLSNDNEWIDSPHIEIGTCSKI